MMRNPCAWTALMIVSAAIVVLLILASNISTDPGRGVLDSDGVGTLTIADNAVTLKTRTPATTR